MTVEQENKPPETNFLPTRTNCDSAAFLNFTLAGSPPVFRIRTANCRSSNPFSVQRGPGGLATSRHPHALGTRLRHYVNAFGTFFVAGEVKIKKRGKSVEHRTMHLAEYNAQNVGESPLWHRVTHVALSLAQTACERAFGNKRRKTRTPVLNSKRTTDSWEVAKEKDSPQVREERRCVRLFVDELLQR